MTLSVLVRIQPPLFIPYEYISAGIAQLVEQRTENPCVPSSNLGPSTPYLLFVIVLCSCSEGNTWNQEGWNLELVAQWTRACGYELQCRGFESLLARFTFPLAKVLLSHALISNPLSPPGFVGENKRLYAGVYSKHLV